MLQDDLRSYLSAHYPELTAPETEKVIGRLENIPSAPLYQGNREAFLLVNEGFDLLRDDPTKLALHINYIDFDVQGNNVFKVVNQYSVQGERLRRPDLILFINGIAALQTMIKGALAKDRVVAILRDYVYYPDDSTKETAIVARYPQFFAAWKMFENIKAHLKPGGDGEGGTYFGAFNKFPY